MVQNGHVGRDPPKSAALQVTGRSQEPKEETAVQAHVRFFDRDNDGVLNPIDTFVGFGALGFNYLICTLAVVFISTFSFASNDSWIPDPFFRMQIRLMARNKHGSDSGAYVRDGRFDAELFEHGWNLATAPPHKVITPPELVKASYSRFLGFDFYGMSAQIFEWITTFFMLGYPTWRFSIPTFAGVIYKTKNFSHAFERASSGGEITKEEVLGCYDASTFYKVALKEAEKGNWLAKKWKRDFEASHGPVTLDRFPGTNTLDLSR